MSRRIGHAADLSAAIMVSQASPGGGFVRLPNCITAHPELGPDEIFIAAEALRLAGDYGSDEAQLSYRYLMNRMRCGQARVRAARERLCNVFPEVFTLSVGSSVTLTPDTITISRDGMLIAHAQWLAAREIERATRSNRTPRIVNVTLSNGNVVQIATPVSNQTHPVPNQTQTCVQSDTPLCPAEHNKKTYKTKNNSSSQLAPLAEEALTQINHVSMPKEAEVQHAQAEKPAKNKGSAASRRTSDADIARFVAVWNEQKHQRFAGKRVASPAERRALEQLISAHSGDMDAALETWTLAVQEVARLGADRNALFWGDVTRKPAPTMANLLPHWGKHSDAARARVEPVAPAQIEQDLSALQPWM